MSINPMLSCRRATELVEKQRTDDLVLSERIRLRLHMLICSACSEFYVQSLMIEGMLEREWLYEEGIPQVSEETAEKLQKKILAQKK